jgi:hypothetical protein
MNNKNAMKKFLQILFLVCVSAGCFNLCAAQGNSRWIEVTSGPTVRVPGLGPPNVLQLMGSTSEHVKWQHNGMVVGEGLTLSTFQAGTFEAWHMEASPTPTDPDRVFRALLATYEITGLVHNMTATVDPLNEVSVGSVCFNSNAYSEYTVQIQWMRNLWDLGLSDGNAAHCTSIVFPGFYWANVKYSYGAQSVTLPVGAKIVHASLNAPVLSQPIGKYNPVTPPTLMVTNSHKFVSYRIFRDNNLIATQTSPSFEVTRHGIYSVGGVTAAGRSVYTQDFLVDKGDIPVPTLSATNGGVLQYENPNVELWTDFGYNNGYTWYKNGQVIANETTNVLKLSKVADVGTYTVKGCATYSDGSSQCKTSAPKEITGEILHVNFVRKKVPLIKDITDPAQLDLLPSAQRNVSSEYVDGFARPIQSVQQSASPLGKDIVIERRYDQFGREAKQVLPFTRQTNDGSYSYIFRSLQPVKDFYQKDNDKTANTAYPFAETQFEASPLNRIVKQGAPGEDWQLAHNSPHVKSFAYSANKQSDNVLIWNQTASGPVASAFHADGSLSITESTDENGKVSREYKSKTNQVVLTEKIIEEGVKLRTYFVFDDMGRLTHVIPPKTSASLSAVLPVAITIDVLSKECYSYRYDERNRVTVKNIPGAGAQYIVYDVWDRVVLTQHANQRTKNKWSFNKFDALNRVVMTGEIVLAGDNTVASQAITSFYATVSTKPTLRYEEPNAGGFHGYTNRSYPVLANQFQVYTATYYDTYGFLSQFGTGYQFVPEPSLELSARSNFTNGLMTGLKIVILGSNTYLKTANYYDNKHRLLQVVSDNHLGGIDRTSNALDFTGRITKTKNIHNGLQAVTIDQEFTYDPQGRKRKVFHAINSGPKILLCDYQYNELGQLVEKNMHSTDGNTFLQSLDYSYNIRGWLAGVNSPADADANTTYPDQYRFELSYTAPSSGSLNDFQPSFNGNIAAFTDARSSIDDTGLPFRSAYTYRYDARDQLTGASYYQLSNVTAKNGRYDMPEVRYDPNGNIMALKRKGVKADGTFGLIDDLKYFYNGNQLIKVDDLADPLKGFVNK